MFAVVSYQGNQYKFVPGSEYKIDLFEDQENKKEVIFSDILVFFNDKDTYIGTPLVPGISVRAEILGVVRGDKVRIFKFRAKKRYKRNLGHCQSYTRIKVLEINKDEK